jgi:lysozyme
MTMPQGILGVDLSRYNNVVDFHAVVASGVKDCFLKATQGLTEIDPRYSEYKQRAKEVGLRVGSYHFFVPEVDPIAQMEHFASVAQFAKGEIIPVIDSETPGNGVGQSTRQAYDKLKAYIYAINSARVPGIYSGQAFFESYLQKYFPNGSMVWCARYGPHPDIDCAAWQFTSTGHIAGIDGSVDEDVFIGTNPANYVL